MNFQKLVNETEDIWQPVINHPFVIEIYQGILIGKRFKFYLLQDYYYLSQSLKNISLLASRAENLEARREMINILHMEATGEFDAYEKLLQSIGIALKEAERANLTRANISYTNYLLSVSSLNSFAEGLTAMLPCYWSYQKISEVHQGKLADNHNKYYKAWAGFYITDEYHCLVNDMRSLFNQVCNTVEIAKLKDAFCTSLKFEYEFWEDVYQMKTWEI
jgi:thiaminase/transcriptional activator TenA